MSLRRKTLLLFLVLGVSLWFGSFAVLEIAVLPAFQQFERESSEQALTRVTRMLGEDLRALEIMNMEYSLWDPTYEYASGRRPEYPDDVLDPDYWHSIDINLLAIFDAQGKELFSWINDPSSGSELSLADELPFVLGPGHPLITHKTEDDSLRGTLKTRSGIMQVVSYPILTSEAKGPIAGAFIVGQALTDERVQKLGERATIDLSILPMSGEGIAAKILTLAQGAPDYDEFVHIETDSDSVRGYSIATDIWGSPIGIFEASGPPRITQIGQKIIQSTMVAFAVAFAIFLATALVSLQKLITAPVTRLTNQMLKIRKSGDLTVDVGISRSDEVGVLAEEFNQLTHGLNRAKTELETARDEAMAMSRAKTEFLARMSHEIRTPMNGVLGMTELLRETALDDKQQRFAGTIYESAESLLHIINDILDISKIEAGRIELDIAPFNLQKLVEECLDLLAESAHAKGLELAGIIDADTDIYVRGDPVRLRQILMNLIGNAVKFTEHGEVVVRVTQSGSDAASANFRFEIADTGIGISAESGAAIFEPFVQEDGSNTRRHGGTGLGLAISKQLVELMGGEIGVDSTPGKGSTFWFTAQLAEEEVSAAHPQPQMLAGKTVFVVDDNETNREILRHQLERWDMQVEVAGSGSEALRILRTECSGGQQFDIMLLDVAMPGMDGLELAEAIRNESEYRCTPIVMLSSNSRTNVEHDRGVAGPDHWLAKPLRQSRLYDMLISLLCQSTISAELADECVPAEYQAPNDSRYDLHVLLVDDNEVNLTVAKAMLDSLGYRATIATNGREAVDAYDTQAFDAVLMDCRMPEMDGFEATQGIRLLEKQRGQKPIPIIALTAHALQGDRQRCLDAGMNDYLSKPFTKKQLGSVLSANTRVAALTADGNLDKISTDTLPVVAEDMPEEKAKILVVDDNEVNRQVTQAMLRSLGYGSETAQDGDEALEKVARNQFDLILMDCHMPVRNGYDTTTEIRLREKQSVQAHRIPIVAVTADFLESNRQRCLDAGMDDYLTKPFTQQQLLTVVTRWLTNLRADDSASVSIDSDGFSSFGDTSGRSSIDREVLDEIRQLDSSPGAAVLRDIVISYCATSARLMLQLRAAVAERDMELVEQLAHSLKGGSGQLGAVLLTSLCDDMISSARANDAEALAAHSERAAVEHCAVLSALDEELQNIAA